MKDQWAHLISMGNQYCMDVSGMTLWYDQYWWSISCRLRAGILDGAVSVTCLETACHHSTENQICLARPIYVMVVFINLCLRAVCSSLYLPCKLASQGQHNLWIMWTVHTKKKNTSSLACKNNLVSVVGVCRVLCGVIECTCWLYTATLGVGGWLSIRLVGGRNTAHWTHIPPLSLTSLPSQQELALSCRHTRPYTKKWLLKKIIIVWDLMLCAVFWKSFNMVLLMTIVMHISRVMAWSVSSTKLTWQGTASPNRVVCLYVTMSSQCTTYS